MHLNTEQLEAGLDQHLLRHEQRLGVRPGSRPELACPFGGKVEEEKIVSVACPAETSFPQLPLWTIARGESRVRLDGAGKPLLGESQVLDEPEFAFLKEALR